MPSKLKWDPSGAENTTVSAYPLSACQCWDVSAMMRDDSRERGGTMGVVQATAESSAPPVEATGARVHGLWNRVRDLLARFTPGDPGNVAKRDEVSLVVNDKGDRVVNTGTVAMATDRTVADEATQPLDHAEDSDAAYARWRRVANGNRRVELTKEAYEEVIYLVEHPREPNARLRAAMARRDQINL